MRTPERIYSRRRRPGATDAPRAAPLNMPNILHLITGLEIGGAERMLARVVARINRERFPSAVVSMTGVGRIGREIAEAGVSLHTLDMPRGLPDPRAIPKLARLMRAVRPDIVQTWLYHADLLGLFVQRLGLAPHLIWNLRCTESTGSPVVRWMLTRFSGFPDAVIANSETGKRFHESIGYRPQRWLTIPNGFDMAALRPNREAGRQRRAELGIPSDAAAVLMPARFDPMKDHATFVAAAARVAAGCRDAVFALAGAGADPANSALNSMIEAHGLDARILLLGERRDLDALYPAFDVVVLSSAYGEGCPNVLGEAMACGVPCVATDVGDSALMIGDTGAVVPPRDPQALAAWIERLIALAPEERHALGLRARERIRRDYDLDAIVARYQALYEEIAAR
jgi:glycosyltransferase involved in cell wall biosynthesis